MDVINYILFKLAQKKQNNKLLKGDGYVCQSSQYTKSLQSLLLCATRSQSLAFVQFLYTYKYIVQCCASFARAILISDKSDLINMKIRTERSVN